MTIPGYNPNPPAGIDTSGFKILKFRDVDYLELEDSPNRNYSLVGGQITRNIYVDDAVIDLAALAFCGNAYTGDNGTVVYLNRQTPHTFPGKFTTYTYGSSRPYVYAQNVVGIKPLGMIGTRGVPSDGTGVAEYQLAEMTIQYYFPTFLVREDNEVFNTDDTSDYFGLPDEGYALERGWENSRYITKIPKPAVREFITNRGMLVDEKGAAILEGIPVREMAGEVTYTWHQVPQSALPQKAWRLGLAAVNNAAFDGFPTGTLLFTSAPELRPMPNIIDGQIYYDVQYRFNILMIPDRTTDPVTPRGHNYIRRMMKVAGKNELVPLLVLSSADAVQSHEETEVFAAHPNRLIYPLFDYKKFFRPDPL